MLIGPTLTDLELATVEQGFPQFQVVSVGNLLCFLHSNVFRHRTGLGGFLGYQQDRMGTGADQALIHCQQNKPHYNTE